MAYVALLRGVNVGGRARVEMARLKATFEGLGLGDVRTYINSGNVVFTGGGSDRARLRRRIERAVTGDFGLDVRVLLRDTGEMAAVVAAMPEEWRDGPEHKCDVLFSDEFTSPESIARLPLTPGLEESLFVPGAIALRTPRARLTRSRLTKIVGTDLYRQMTIRNGNTARMLHQLLVAADG